ncbi:plant/protein [Perilla frutescens var. frutescens]|nr:plant/protein [Perilla frutescens var. frutescens]
MKVLKFRNAIATLIDSPLSLLIQVKQWIADAVVDKQEPVAVTTTIQEEICAEMGVGD